MGTTKLARRALAQSPRGWAILPNPFAIARGKAARARWLTRLSATSCPAGETFALALVVDDGCQWQNAVEK